MQNCGRPTGRILCVGPCLRRTGAGGNCGGGKAQLESEQGLNALLLTGQGLKIKKQNYRAKFKNNRGFISYIVLRMSYVGRGGLLGCF
jgi:hypothetical protein